MSANNQQPSQLNNQTYQASQQIPRNNQNNSQQIIPQSLQIQPKSQQPKKSILKNTSQNNNNDQKAINVRFTANLRKPSMTSDVSEHEEQKLNSNIEISSGNINDPSSIMFPPSNINSNDNPSSFLPSSLNLEFLSQQQQNQNSVEFTHLNNSNQQQQQQSFKQKFITETQQIDTNEGGAVGITSKSKTLNTNRISEIQQQIVKARQSLVRPQNNSYDSSIDQNISNINNQQDPQLGSKLKQVLGLGIYSNNTQNSKRNSLTGRFSVGGFNNNNNRFSVIGEQLSSISESSNSKQKHQNINNNTLQEQQQQQQQQHGNSTFNNDDMIEQKKRQTFNYKNDQQQQQSLDNIEMPPVAYENDLDITFVNDQPHSKGMNKSNKNYDYYDKKGRSSPMIRDNYDKIPGLTQEQYINSLNHLNLLQQSQELKGATQQLESALEQLQMANEKINYEQLLKMDELIFQINEIEKQGFMNLPQDHLTKLQDEELKDLVQQLDNLQLDDQTKVQFLEKVFSELNLIKDDQTDLIAGVANIARQSLDSLMIDYTTQTHFSQKNTNQISNLMFLNLNLDEKLMQVQDTLQELNLNNNNNNNFVKSDEEQELDEICQSLTKQLNFIRLLDEVVMIKQISAQTFELRFKIDIRQAILTNQVQPDINGGDGYIYLTIQVQLVQNVNVGRQKIVEDQTNGQQIKVYLESKGQSNSWYIPNNKYTLDQYIDKVLQIICEYEDTVNQ